MKNKGFISHKPIHFIDVLPTLLELTGVEYPESFNGDKIFPTPGKSFLPQILGDSIDERDEPIFWQWRNGKAVRDGNWKLVSHEELWELYNLEIDPVEEINLIDKEKEKATELKSLYDDWFDQF